MAETLEQKRDRLIKEQEEVERQIAARAKWTETQRLAVDLHEMSCRLNHDDMCGWFYEIDRGFHDWGRFTHTQYLARAADLRRALPDSNNAEILRIGKIFRGY